MCLSPRFNDRLTIGRNITLILSSRSIEIEMYETAVSRWETDPPEVVADSRLWRIRGWGRITHHYYSLISNVEFSCEIDASLLGPENGSKFHPWKKLHNSGMKTFTRNTNLSMSVIRLEY